MNFLSQDEFLKLSQKGNLIPVYKEILGDFLTPTSAYMHLAKKAKYSFLLESMEGQEKFARFSFIACHPSLIVRTKDSQAEIIRIVKGKAVLEKKSIQTSPLDIVRELMKDYKAVDVAQLPRFYGGMVGFLSYDCVRFFERLPQKTEDDLKFPDMIFVLAQDLVIFDHRYHTIKVVSCVHLGTVAQLSPSVKVKKYREAIKKIDGIIKELRQPIALKSFELSGKKKIKVTSNYTQKQYETIIQAAKKYIYDGDIIQVVPSQRFEANITVEPFAIYRSLRALNPSPYMFYLNFDSLQLVGASPELLVRCENGLVETRPIAGTRPRGKTLAEDEALEKELLADPKEKAEHVMLVDLGRNDLGRVCEQGTVKLSEFMLVERYSHVMHIVSNVQGKLRQDKDALDALQAAFPAGTVSGAPKIRAMEIIEELESQRRGPYAGAVGYFSFSKNLDTCITIRTIVVYRNKAYVQAGGGLVADSHPATEYQETVNKARAQIRAIELAH